MFYRRIRNLDDDLMAKFSRDTAILSLDQNSLQVVNLLQETAEVHIEIVEVESSRFQRSTNLQ